MVRTTRRLLSFSFLPATIASFLVGEGAYFGSEAFAAAPPSASAEEQAAPPTIPGKWRLRPIFLRGAEVPDQPGCKLDEILDAYSLESGVVAFWATLSKPGEKKNPQGVFSFSLKDGKLRTVRMEGDDGLSPYMLADSSGKAEKLHLYHSEDLAGGLTRGPRQETPIHAGERLLYFSFHTGMGDIGCSVYAWDGEHLRRVLGAGDELLLRGER